MQKEGTLLALLRHYLSSFWSLAETEMEDEVVGMLNPGQPTEKKKLIIFLNWGLVPGIVSLVLGFVNGVLGIFSWVLGSVSWVLGFSRWVLGFVFWVSGTVFWVSLAFVLLQSLRFFFNLQSLGKQVSWKAEVTYTIH